MAAHYVNEFADHTYDDMGTGTSNGDSGSHVTVQTQSTTAPPSQGRPPVKSAVHPASSSLGGPATSQAVSPNKQTHSCSRTMMGMGVTLGVIGIVVIVCLGLTAYTLSQKDDSGGM